MKFSFEEFFWTILAGSLCYWSSGVAGLQRVAVHVNLEETLLQKFWSSESEPVKIVLRTFRRRFRWHITMIRRIVMFD